jgi:hypothetical protein
VLNVVNPEAVVVRHNLDAAPRLERYDPDYVARLSDDAVLAVVANLDRMNAAEFQRTLQRIGCDQIAGPRHRGWAAFNLGRERAAAARARACEGRSLP